MAKTIKELELSGSIKKHKKQYEKKVAAEKLLQSVQTLEQGTSIDPPKTITDPYVKNYYTQHTKYLIDLGVLQISDIPEIDTMFLTLQQLRQVEKKLQEIDITDDSYFDYLKAKIKLANLFSSYCVRYYISPYARSKLQIDRYDAGTKKVESENTLAKLLNK